MVINVDPFVLRKLTEEEHCVLGMNIDMKFLAQVALEDIPGLFEIIPVNFTEVKYILRYLLFTS